MMSRLNAKTRFGALSLLLSCGLSLGCAGSQETTPLSNTASEDMSHLLAAPETAPGRDFDVPRNFLPDRNVDWVVTVQFAEPCNRAKIESAIGNDWQSDHGVPKIYGFTPETGCWSYVFAADAPPSFNRLKVAWSLWDGIHDRPRVITADELNRYRDATEGRLKSVGGFEIATETSAEDSLASVESLSELVAECDQDVTLWLRASSGQKFDGRDIWDVMLCLGLDYGDGNLFHWLNNSGLGDDHFFTVQTSTPPGYFVPQKMASGVGNVDDLMTNFSIPRSADPMTVFDSMVNAVKYAQARLGGEIVLESGESWNETAERQRIEGILKRMQSAGFVPGEPSTCRIF